jgi:muconolactone delta-isomerase
MSINTRSLTKYLAIGTFPDSVTPQQWKPYMPKEVPATLQLYVEGKMDQFWLRDDGKGVVFIMTTESVEEADALLKALPLGQAGLLRFELIAIGPLTPLGMLIQK